MQLNLCRETVAITYFNFLYQLAASVEATQLYDQASPAQQKNAAIVNSLFQLHQSVTKVTLSIRAQLFESRLALNPGLNLTRVSFSGVQKHFVG